MLAERHHVSSVPGNLAGRPVCVSVLAVAGWYRSRGQGFTGLYPDLAPQLTGP